MQLGARAKHTHVCPSVCGFSLCAVTHSIPGNMWEAQQVVALNVHPSHPATCGVLVQRPHPIFGSAGQQPPHLWESGGCPQDLAWNPAYSPAAVWQFHLFRYRDGVRNTLMLAAFLAFFSPRKFSAHCAIAGMHSLLSMLELPIKVQDRTRLWAKGQRPVI